MRAEINGASELETVSGTPASAAFTAIVQGDYGRGFEDIGGGYSLTWSMTPDGAKDIAFSDGTLSVGASADIGTYDFTVNVEAVSGSLRASAQKSVKVTVKEYSPVSDDVSRDIAPVFVEAAYSVSDIPGQEMSITVTASAGANLTWSVSGEFPGGLTGTPDENTYTIAGMLSLADAGRTYTLTVTASNSAGTADAGVTITIQDIAPKISSTVAGNITVRNGQEISPVILW